MWAPGLQEAELTGRSLIAWGPRGGGGGVLKWEQLKWEQLKRAHRGR